jgi:hypothetical protein
MVKREGPGTGLPSIIRVKRVKASDYDGVIVDYKPTADWTFLSLQRPNLGC